MMTNTRSVCAIAAAAALFAISTGARSETIVERSAEHRFQLDFHVNDAALQKFLPAGWQPAVATQGPAKDANIRMIFIDRMAIMGADGKPLAHGANRMVYLVVPVRETAGPGTGQMIIAGLTADPADAPGAFGVYKPATTAKMARNESSDGNAVMVDEDWAFAAADGERMQVHVRYQRAPAVKGGGEVKFFDPKNPAKYQIFRTEQGIDITRNATTNPPDRVQAFSYSAGGGAIASLFDGSEKVLSWDSFPWYDRTVAAP